MDLLIKDTESEYTKQLMSCKYILDIPVDYRRNLAIAWLLLAVLTLFGAGIFSVLLVLARTPLIGEMIPFVDFFHTALVIHVNLSSLVWILSFACVLWSLNSRSIFPWFAKSIFVVVLVGTLIITLFFVMRTYNFVLEDEEIVLEHYLLYGFVIQLIIGMFSIIYLKDLFFFIVSSTIICFVLVCFSQYSLE